MKTAFISCEELKKLVRRHPTPFYLYDEAGIRACARRVLSSFSWNSGYRQYFAVKATPNLSILKILRQEGLGAECSSAAELELARRAGFTPGELLFAPNFPPEEDVLACAKTGCPVILDGLPLIDYFAQRGALKEPAGLRFNPGGEFFAGGEKISRPEDSKFGFTHPQLEQGLEQLKALGHKSFGLHGYMAGNVQSPAYYPELARLLFETGAELSQKSGMELTFIDLSGGVGVGYRWNEPTPDITAIAAAVFDVYDDVFIPRKMKPAIYTELGRYITAPYGLLVATVIHKKSIGREFIGLDACSADLMRPMLYGAYHHIEIAGRETEPHDHICDVVGSICENTDRLAVSRPLPAAEIGDIAVIFDAGAHGHSMGYNYGGKLRSAELLLREDGRVIEIRRRETVRDYLATQLEPEL